MGRYFPHQWKSGGLVFSQFDENHTVGMAGEAGPLIAPSVGFISHPMDGVI